MKNELNTKVIGVESLDEDKECFQLNVKGLPCELTLSRKRQPKTFEMLMDAMRDNRKLNNSELFSEVNEQEKTK
jgi:hypothetical protein